MIPHKTKSITLTNQKTIFYNLLKYSRKTLELSISPEKEITIKAPKIMPNFMIESFIKKKSDWIIKKLNKKTQTIRPIKQAKFKNHESHNFLGKTYPLIITKADLDEVRLINEQICIIIWVNVYHISYYQWLLNHIIYKLTLFTHMICIIHYSHYIILSYSFNLNKI